MERVAINKNWVRLIRLNLSSLLFSESVEEKIVELKPVSQITPLLSSISPSTHNEFLSINKD